MKRDTSLRRLHMGCGESLRVRPIRPSGDDHRCRRIAGGSARSARADKDRS